MEFTLRMRDLEQATALPASAIRYYLREGLLPEPERPTPNSALYGQVHVEALNALRRIKTAAPDLPLIQMRRVLELVGQGVEPEVALSLHRSVGAGAGASLRDYDRDALAHAAGIEPDMIDRLMEARILVPMNGEAGDPVFNDVDRQIAAAIGPFSGLVPELIARMAAVADHVRQASALEMTMRNDASQGGMADRAAEISYQMQEFANLWHAYLFARFRLLEIAEQGLGDVTPVESEPG